MWGYLVAHWWMPFPVGLVLGLVVPMFRGDVSAKVRDRELLIMVSVMAIGLILTVLLACFAFDVFTAYAPVG